MNGAGTDVTWVPVYKLSLPVGVGMWLYCVAVLWGGQMRNTLQVKNMQTYNSYTILTLVIVGLL
jgi:hypothetical protein